MDITQHIRVTEFIVHVRQTEMGEVFENFIKALEALPEEGSEHVNLVLLLRETREATPSFQKFRQSLSKSFHQPIGAIT